MNACFFWYSNDSLFSSGGFTAPGVAGVADVAAGFLFAKDPSGCDFADCVGDMANMPALVGSPSLIGEVTFVFNRKEEVGARGVGKLVTLSRKGSE